MSEILLAIVD
jgi:RimJ/RimL family protein N-acetyltransferase